MIQVPRRCALSFHLSLQSIVYQTDAHWWRWLIPWILLVSSAGETTVTSVIFCCTTLLSQSLLWPNINCCNGIWSEIPEILSVEITGDLLRSTGHKQNLFYENFPVLFSFYLAKFRISSFDSFFKALRVLYQLLFSVKERVLTDYSVSPRKSETCHPNYLKIEYFVSRSLLRLLNTK